MIEIFTAFMIGVVSAGHCLGMCGGLMVAAGLNTSNSLYLYGYNSGRIITYLLLVLLVGSLAHQLPVKVVPWLQLLSGILVILTALYFLGINHWVAKFERVGEPLWRAAQPLSRKLLPVRSLKSSLILGMLWGLIPCGLIYTALVFSLSQPSLIHSLLAMLAFAIGTLPAMIGSALFANQLRSFLADARSKLIMASLLMAGGAFILYRAITMMVSL